MKVRTFAMWSTWVLFLACIAGYWTNRNDILMAFEFVLLSLVTFLVALLATWALMRHRRDMRNYQKALAAEAAMAHSIPEPSPMRHKGQEVDYFGGPHPCDLIASDVVR